VGHFSGTQGERRHLQPKLTHLSSFHARTNLCDRKVTHVCRTIGPIRFSSFSATSCRPPHQFHWPTGCFLHPLNRNNMAAKIRTGFSRAALIGAMSLSSLAMIAPTVVCGNTGTFLPSGLYITPTAVPGASYLALNPGLGGKLKDVIAGGAVSSALSPDGKTLAVLTGGYNSWTVGKTNVTNEYIFIFDVSAGAPVQTQVIALPSTFVGIIFSPDGTTLYVGGGSDDSIHWFTQTGGKWTESATPTAFFRGTIHRWSRD